MSEEVLYRVCYGSSTPTNFQKSLLTTKPAILHSYRRHKVRYGDYPAIIGCPNSSVRGSYVRGLTEGDIWRLDIFEGNEYERRKVKIKTLKEVGDDKGKGNVEGEEVEVETYVWIAGKEALEDGEWDFEEFRREKMHRWVGRRDDYDGELRPSILGLSSAGREVWKRLTRVKRWMMLSKLKAKIPLAGGE